MHDTDYEDRLEIGSATVTRIRVLRKTTKAKLKIKIRVKLKLKPSSTKLRRQRPQIEKFSRGASLQKYIVIPAQETFFQRRMFLKQIH